MLPPVLETHLVWHPDDHAGARAAQELVEHVHGRHCDRLADAVGPAPNFRLVVRRLGRWSGIPFARNRGAEATSCPILLITDANTCYPQNWDRPIQQHFHPGRLLTGTIVDEATGARGYGLTLDLPSMGVGWLTTPHPFGGYVPVATSACTVIDRCLFHHLGGYDETLPLYGAAEPEFSVRAWLAGYEIVNVPDLVVGHRFRPPQDRSRFHQLNQQVLLRNYVRFACSYLPEDLLTYGSIFTRRPWAAISALVWRSCNARGSGTGVRS
jgi:hypothetical protein